MPTFTIRDILTNKHLTYIYKYERPAACDMPRSTIVWDINDKPVKLMVEGVIYDLVEMAANN